MGIEQSYLFQNGGYPAVILGGFIILVITGALSKIAVYLLRRLIHRTTDGEVGGSIIANIIRVTVWVIGISVLLAVCFNVDVTVLWGALGIGGIALSLGLQNTVSNLIGGFQISLSRDIAIGDWVTIGTMSGEVMDITWRVTKVHDALGYDHIIPNSVLNTTAVTALPEWQRVQLSFVMARNADIDEICERVPEIAFEAQKAAGMDYEDMVPMFSVSGTAVDSVTATLVIYAHRKYSVLQVSEAVSPNVVEYLRSVDALAICGA